MPSRSPTLAEVLEAHRESVLRDLRVAMPAEVTAYRASEQMVDVRPLIADWFTEDDGTVSQVRAPMVVNVPVAFPRGGGFGVLLPIQPGDTVLLVVSDRSIDGWLAQGGPQTPVDLRRHNISDAIAIPGVYDAKHKFTSAPTDHMVLGKDNGPQVKLKASTIELGNGTDSVALASKVTSQLNALKSAINGWTPIANDGGAALKTALSALFSTWPGSVGSATVKAKD